MHRRDGSPRDLLARVIGRGGSFRGLAVRSTSVAREIAALHGTLPTATAALTRVVTAALLLGGTLKGREQVSIQVLGNGPLGEIMAIADARGNVRATLDNPYIDLPARPDGKFDVGTAVGRGDLVVTKSLGLKEPYRSVVPLVTGEIATDVAHYFLRSEQKPTAMGLGELIEAGGLRAAGGFFVQAFPDAADEELADIEAAIGALPAVSELMAQGVSPGELLGRILPDAIELPSSPVQRNCTCGAERLESILVALGEEELRELIGEQETTELRCHFCNSKYNFDRDALRGLLERSRS